MSARHKLNIAHINGAALAAAVLGAATGSWAVFLVTLIIFAACGLHAGDIRPDRRKR